ncbi:MAG: hypothetical protein KatS3mg031_2581 [Chitinophagales bacterium]|nr:MAG: hypothetical protein KatS3mg031_2581 [Chitinophagales bacterium]
MKAVSKKTGLFLSILFCIPFFSEIQAQTCTGDPNSMVLDDDYDGYSNGDETLNGTDRCSSLSFPSDFDGDFLSDLPDPDDDNDGIPDTQDKFALDKNNGTTTTIPVHYTFQHPVENGGFGNSGFTGLMTNGSDDYMTLYNSSDISISGSSNKFTVNNIPGGDVLGSLNSQKNAFQFGVNTGAFPFNFIVSTRVMAPFANVSPSDFQSMGLYIGTGDQDNYLKITCAANGGNGGIEVTKEVAGAVTSSMYTASVVGSGHVTLYLTVNRSNNTVQPAYSINGGPITNAGPSIAIPSSWLTNVLAVGIISTSRGATAFSASWDYIAVRPIEGPGQWNTITTTNTCAARHDCGFVQVGTRFFLLGGHGTTGLPTENYNFVSKTWATSGDVRDATPPIPLHHFQAVQIRGLIYVGCAFTGNTPNDIPAENVYYYDPSANLWHVGRLIPESRRRGASAAVVYNEKIYFIGGLKSGHNAGWTNYLDVYDPQTNTWTVLPDAPRERDHFQAVVHNGKIYCIGGRKTGFGGNTYAETVKEIDVYNIAEQTWSTLPSPECDIPTPRAGAGVGLIGDEIFVIGGESILQTGALGTNEAFNVKTKSWRALADMNTGRHGTQAIVNNYAIYIAAGAGNRGESPDLNSIEVYYPYGQTTPTGTAYVKGSLAQLPSANIAFGQVPIGTTSTKTIIVKNSGGTQAMIIKSIHLAQNSTNYFTVNYPYPTPFILNPGDSVKIDVTFRPNSTSNINGTLYVSNTGINGDNTSFGLTGTGTTQQPAIRVNCAGPQYTAASSDVFSEDYFNIPGTIKTSTSQPINGTTDGTLYQTARVGTAFSYAIPVQSNTYTVKLHFAEISPAATGGMNVFYVKIENSTKINALDLYTSVGPYRALIQTFTIQVTDQMMNIDFIASAGNAQVSAIELIPAPVTQGVLTVVPMPVNFPETDLNSNSVPITVALTNTGAASLTINSVNITGPHASNFVHTYGTAATTLAPGGTKTFTITFNPTASGTRTATLTVTHTGNNSPVNVPLNGIGSSTETPCGYFVEQNGLLVMEVESHKPTGYWTPGTSIPNYTGTAYYTWQGPNYFFEKGNGLLRYEFKITTPGKYRFRLRSRHPGPDPNHWNDIWVRFPDHGAIFEKNGAFMGESGTGWWKAYMNTMDAWTYNTWGLTSTFWDIYVIFKDPGIYYLDLSGRVEYFTIDRIVLYQTSRWTDWQACGSNPPQSPWEPCPTIPYTWYRDKDLDDYGDPNVSMQSISKPGVGWIWNNQDCNDNNNKVYPGAPEILDGLDNDCDGIIDEGALLDALNINCGGSQYTAVNGDVFVSDRLFSPSNTSVKFYNNTGDILNTDDDNLFKSERLNSQYTTSFSYNMKAAPGKFYKISLYFAEVGTVVNPGERVFKVTIEDSVVLDNFDIIATVGYKNAYVYDAYVYLKDSVLNIKFIDIIGKAKVNAIKASIQPNIPPTFKISPVFLTLNEDFNVTKYITVTPDPVLPHEAWQTVTYSLSPPSCSFANVSINPVTGKVTITSVPNGNGLQVFTIIADDGQAENNIATKTFQLKVLAINDPPVFTLSGNVNVNKNFTGTISVTTIPAPVPANEQNQIVTYSLSPPSVSFANVSIDPYTGTISIKSIPNMFGSQTFTVTANDGQSSNNTYSQTFTLTVNDINYPPTIDAIADMIIDEDAGMQTVHINGVTAGLGETQNITITASSDNPLLIPNLIINYSSPDASGLLYFAPSQNINGTANITITVSDGELTTSRMFKVTVNPVNDPPMFTLSGNVTVAEDFTSTEIVSVTPAPVPADETSQVVSYSIAPASVSFANIAFNPATGQVSITSLPDASGSQTFTLTANDGQSQNNLYAQTFTLTVNPVNDPPMFTLSGNVTVAEDFTSTEIVSVTPAPVPADEATQTVTYSITPASVPFANIAFNPATGQVSITSVPNASGSQTFTLTANDGQSQNNLYAQTFTLTVNPVNDPPMFTLSGNVTVAEDFTSTEIVSVTPAPVPADETSQVVSYSIAPASVPFANIAFNPATGQVSITSLPDASGSQTFTITANDGQSQNNLYTQTFTLTVNPVNDPPMFTLSGDVTLDEDFTPLIVSVIPNLVPLDETGQLVTYSISPAAVSFAHVSINSQTGEILITAVPDASGSQTFVVIADDGESDNNIFQQSFTLTVNPVNDPPAFSVSGDLNLMENFSTVETVTVYPFPVPADEQNQVVMYSLTPASVSFANVSIDPATGTVTVTSVPNQSGVAVFTITANDGGTENNLYSQTFVLSVGSVNSPPVFTVSGNVIVDEDFVAPQVVTVTPNPVPDDESGQTVIYSLSPSSVNFANVSFNPSTGKVTITAVPDANGTQVFTITADDGQSQNNLYVQTFTLTVNPVNDPPMFTLSGNVTVAEDFTSTEIVSVTPAPVPADETGQIVTYAIQPSSVTFADISFNTITGEVVIQSLPDASGSQTFTLTANDGQSQNNLYTQTFTLTVNPVNDPPTLDTIRDPVAIFEDAGPQWINLTGISAGGNENQPLNIMVTTDNPGLFASLYVSYNYPSASGSVHYQPVANQWGSTLVTITVDDGQASDNTTSRSFTVVVLPVNDAPVFSISGDVTVDEDFTSTEIVTVTPAPVPADEATQTVTYSITPASVPFANITFDSTSGQVTITAIPDAHGSQVFTIIADDGQPQNNIYAATFTLTVLPVNDPPIFTILPDQITVTKNFAAPRHFVVQPGPVPADEASQTVSYSLQPNSISFAHLSFDSLQGVVTFTSLLNATGSQTFTITADDGQNLNNLYSASFSFSVIDTNYQPTLDAIADPPAIDEDAGMQSILLTGISAGWGESQHLSVSAVADSAWLFTHLSVSYNSPDSSAVLYFMPAADRYGSAIVTVTVDDGQPVNNTISRSFHVVVNPVNDAPAFDPISNPPSIPEDAGTQYVFLSGITAGPYETQNLSITAVSDNPALIPHPAVNYSSPDTSAILSYTPLADAFGTAVITVTVEDGQPLNNSFSRQFTVTVLPVNDAPVVTDVYKPGQEDKAVGFHAADFISAFSDVDADTLQMIRIVSLPAHGVLLLGSDPVAPMDQLSTLDIQYLTYYPHPDYFGQDTFQWNGYDGALYAAANASVFIHLNPVNDIPVATALIPDILVDEDTAPIDDYVNLNSLFYDVEEGTQLSFGVVNTAPHIASVSIDATHHLDIAFQPNAYGIADVTITASDSYGSSAEIRFTITVNPVEDPPSVFVLISPDNGSQVDLSQPIRFIWSASADADADPVAYTLFIHGHQLDTAIAALADTTISFDALSLLKMDSLYTWYVVASDGDDFTPSGSFTFKVGHTTGITRMG